jgi:predicted transcriptional regulator
LFFSTFWRALLILKITNRTVNNNVKKLINLGHLKVYVARRHNDLTSRILDLLEKDPGQHIQELARGLKINRTFLAGYLKALETMATLSRKKELLKCTPI